MQVQWKASFIVAALALSFATVFQNVSQSYKNLRCAERVAVHHRGLRDLLARPPKSNNIWLIFSHLFRVNTPDTTVVILNWSRFPNVINITSVLCHPELADIIAEIFIWNNSPNSISLTDFNQTGCPSRKIRIHNSPTNLYFQARFKACVQVNTKFCFVQDDDYLILPEILHALHARILELHSPEPIHLLPAHEHLSSTLRTLHAPRNPPRNIHASFAWLGHGTLLRRTRAVDFLDLMHQLNTTEDEMKMADNYYSIRSNRVPEIWFDQGIELGGGQPFTTGTAGDERNSRHILQAARYLDDLAMCTISSCDKWPYTSLTPRRDPASAKQQIFSAPASREPMRTVCVGRVCILESNIPLVLKEVTHDSDKAGDILAVADHNTRRMGENGIAHYVSYPPSHMVDGRAGTLFRSPLEAMASEYIALNLLHDVNKAAQVMLLVDNDMLPILLASSVQVSSNGTVWNTRRASWRCAPMGDSTTLQQECSASFSSSSPFRHVRVLLNEDVARRWAVYEMWVQ